MKFLNSIYDTKNVHSGKTLEIAKLTLKYHVYGLVLHTYTLFLPTSYTHQFLCSEERHLARSKEGRSWAWLITYNPRIWEAETGGLLSLRTTWAA
jgi:hypothetical protein